MKDHTSALLRALLLLAVLGLVAAACGDTTAVDPAGITSTTEAAAMDDATIVDQHDHTIETLDVAAADAPSLSITATPDPKSGLNVFADVAGMELVPHHAGGAHVAGEGHLHIYVDGVKIGRVYSEWYHLDGIAPGEHQIEVTANSNTHAALVVDGVPVSASVTVDVPESRTGSHMHQESREADTEMTVALEVLADPVGGWNAFITATGFTWAPERASGDHVDGEGHAHLYVDGAKIARLYGPAYHFSIADPGEHTITVSLNGNDHRPYSRNGQPVEAAAAVEVAGEVTDRAADVTIRARVTGGAVVGESRHEVSVGDVVEIMVSSDVADRLHVHGYDLFARVAPGDTATVRFTADIPGIFEVELEDSGLLVFDLTVR